jgi:hypothetical protein
MKTKGESSKENNPAPLSALWEKNIALAENTESAEKRLKKIGHPDEIEKKKHFIGQADAHGQLSSKLKAESSKQKIQRGDRRGRGENNLGYNPDKG